MSSTDRDVRIALQQKIRELRADLATLTAALAVLGGGRPARSPTDDPPRVRRSLRAQFDAMMTILSARKTRSLTPAQVRDALRAKGQLTGDYQSVLKHLAQAVTLGYVLKRAKGYQATATIRKITQTDLTPPTARRKVNGTKSAKPDNYGIVLRALRDGAGPQTAAALTAAANQRGGKLNGDSSVHYFLRRGIDDGFVKKSTDGYTITEKGQSA